LRYDPSLSSSLAAASASSTNITQEQDVLFIRLSQARLLVEKKRTLSVKTSRGRTLLSSQDAMRLYGPWLVD